jgi:ribonucleoside-diphosphate reductase alpha chain
VVIANQKTGTTKVKTTNRNGRKPATSRRNSKRKPIRIERRFTVPGIHPYEGITWETRSAVITNESGEVIFEQNNVEIPSAWTQLATNVVVSKYFKGAVDRPGREHSVRQIVDRVVKTIKGWGVEDGNLATPADAEAFEAELTHMLVHQVAAFNSPVWFNCGIEEKPQCSACFINSVDDSMEDILGLAKTEGMLFKFGSGTGTNFSRIRGSKERLSSGGWASGPVSFMRGYDSFAGVIKSGGKTRRAAKMVILDIDHPDILEFIQSKSSEEKKAWALIEAGYDGSFNGEAYNSVFFQNANHSIRVTSEFMQAVVDGKDWDVKARTSGETMETYPARDLMREIADASHVCGDPGLQFDSTINEWHTCSATDRIYASNPCSEFMFLDDTACNLASLNLLKFVAPDGTFDVETFRHAVRVLVTAQEIIVDNAFYPTNRIGKMSHKFRPLGLGYANLGALLMSRGLPYDSNAGRAFAGAITSIMTGEAYAQSARISGQMGPFSEFRKNRKPMLGVMLKHRDAVEGIDDRLVPEGMIESARTCWNDALDLGKAHGFRNSQVTVLAPTGTIGFMMDCDTTGIEPDIALVKYKRLVGGGMLKIVNQTIPSALSRLGYDEDAIADIIEYIDEQETIEGAPGLEDEHLPVFDCAFKPRNGSRSIHYMGHVRMMAAVQPFLSGAISKTVNMPNEITTDEIADAYMEAWKLGLKSIAIYRDGSKRTQPLTTDTNGQKEKAEPEKPEKRPIRRRLPDERQAITHKFSISGHEGYITVGKYEDGDPGEIFVVMAKEGSVVSGLMDTVATMTSIALQYGVPLEVLTSKFEHTRFEPSGLTINREIPIAKSPIDYIFRWLHRKFGQEEPGMEIPIPTTVAPPPSKAAQSAARSQEKVVFETQADAPPCPGCGSMMIRNGACYKCLNCGATSGCS